MIKWIFHGALLTAGYALGVITSTYVYQGLSYFFYTHGVTTVMMLISFGTGACAMYLDTKNRSKKR